MAKTRNTSVITPSSLGRLLLVKLEKEKYLFFPEDELFCSTVVVTTPEKDVVHFPCYRWVSRGKAVELRGGKASKAFEDELPLLVDHRKKELDLHQGLFTWKAFADGLPHLNSVKEPTKLPVELAFSISKEVETTYTRESGMIELKMKGFADSSKTWEDLDMMKQVFWFKKTPISEYVSEHWKEDEFFGSQFLNGANPNVIQRCSVLPLNFPVTDQMVQRFLEKGSSLEMEMRKGNLFLCDYKRLQGVPTYEVNGKPLPLTAAFCLFYKNPEDKLLPIAIQLNQQHSEQNPIFLPSDSENDWLLAKMFVRNADFTEHQYSYHLLATHLLAEVFAMATLRNLPIMHPLYKLLIPHFRYTVAINTISFKQHFGTGAGTGAGTGETTLGLEGLKELLKRAHSEITYSSLCLPENIIARGLDTIPNFYYRDDGIKLWDIINTFVQKMVEHFYPSDSEVSRDSELQNWINEIFIHGFLGNVQSEIPQEFHTVKQVIQFITMVIFNVSAQHSAVNMGQFDYCSWIANSPPFLRKAPPATKGSSTMSTILETLPDVGSTVKGMASMWLQSKRYSDFIPLGSYPEEYFDEDEKYFDVTKKIMKYFQAELSYLSESIDERNSTLTIPYNYLNPAEMENSVSL
ncbi:hydroperoxide isomerase ALOXE3 [Esox lucius]|uniref:hydroperoxide isomerase ALOXE3 n=1 Tax=Esox lucius TaxID=8010 RepID=UPI00147735F9|nr:hydroperoxide isomerase ALOXE3 [Esox lucius]